MLTTMLTAATYEARRQAIATALIERRAAYDALALDLLDAGETPELRAIADEIQKLQGDEERLAAAWRASQARETSAIDTAKQVRNAEALRRARTAAARAGVLGGYLEERFAEVATLAKEIAEQEATLRGLITWGVSPWDAIDLVSGFRLLATEDLTERLAGRGPHRMDMGGLVAGRADGALSIISRRLAPPAPEVPESVDATTTAPEEVTA